MSRFNDSSAVDYQRFAVRQPMQEQAATLEVLPGEQAGKKPRASVAPYGKYMAIIFCVFAVLIGIVGSYMHLAELTTQNAKLEKQLAVLKSDENALNAKKEQLYNLTDVENYAKSVLGMVKAEKSQITYVELSNAEKMVVNQQQEKKTSGFLKNLAHSFSTVLEYLN